jgi:hypothetical protein
MWRADVDARPSNERRWAVGAGLVAAGVVSGAILAGTLSAGAATSPTTPATPQYRQSAGPGVQENDGIPESQEHHGGSLNQTGSVTAVGTDTVIIKTSSGTTTYKVDSSSDIDKNGEAQLSNMADGDAVRFSVQSGTTTIDKLHAGDESKDLPTAPQNSNGSSTSPSGSASGAGENL